MKEWAEAPHLQLACYEIQPGLKLRAFECSASLSELFPRNLVGDVLADGHTLGEHGAIIELKGWYKPKWIDGSVIDAVVHELRVLVNLDFLKGQFGLVEYDVGEH